MPKQKFYIIIKAEGDNFSVALPTDNMFSIYCYLDKLVQSGRNWQSHFMPESEVIKKYTPVPSDMELWR